MGILVVNDAINRVLLRSAKRGIEDAMRERAEQTVPIARAVDTSRADQAAARPSRLGIHDIKVELLRWNFVVDEAAGSQFNRKLYLTFIDRSDFSIEVISGTWMPKPNQRKVEHPIVWQIEGAKGQENNDWVWPESPTVRINAGQAFRTWIGLGPHTRAENLRRWIETKSLGMLAVTMKSTAAISRNFEP